MPFGRHGPPRLTMRWTGNTCSIGSHLPDLRESSGGSVTSGGRRRSRATCRGRDAGSVSGPGSTCEMVPLGGFSRTDRGALPAIVVSAPIHQKSNLASGLPGGGLHWVGEPVEGVGGQRNRGRVGQHSEAPSWG